MIDRLVPQEMCFGCSACKNYCPKKAISLVKDHEGFFVPKVESRLCVNCGACSIPCPAIHAYQGKPVLPKTYSARIANERDLFDSTSGGVFTALSNYVLSQGGYICGAIFDDKFNVIHAIASTQQDRNRMRGAKYVQSDLSTVFSEIKILLEGGNFVLFTGTPCQVHALSLFLRKEYKRLFTIDIICHGVPSNETFHAFLHSLEKRHGAIKQIRFRSKALGWKGNNLQIRFSSGKTISNTKETQKYTSLFGRGYLLRRRCFSCPYSSVFRVGDISIGDCWGLEHTDSAFNDNKGCSLIIINNDKGDSLFSAIRNQLILEKRSIPEILQPNLYKPTSKPKHFERIRCKVLFSNYWK